MDMGMAGPTVSWSITCTKLHGERALTPQRWAQTNPALGTSLQYTLTPRADAPVGVVRAVVQARRRTQRVQ